MVQKTQTGMRQALSRGRWLLCLLVAITFLYNPFLGTASELGVPNVNHPPSFRATVASLEMLKFTPKEKNETVVAPDGDVQSATVVAPLGEETRVEEIRASAPAPSKFLPQGNLFFRPPPAA
jgi:hypothetical protein